MQNETSLAHIIVVGNEKGGAGKTTSAMHVTSSLLGLGFRVATIDVDSRQQSLTHYLQNRAKTNAQLDLTLAMPTHQVIPLSYQDYIEDAKKDEQERFMQALASILYRNDFIVIDTPGTNSHLSALAHSYADTLITPINDSFVDLDVLAMVDPTTHKITGPGVYSEMVWQQKMTRANRDRRSINWVVMRNRLSTVDAKNKRLMQSVLDQLAQRVGFRHAPGFSERVVFRELFLQGMTLLDLRTKRSPISLKLSHVAARQELREFLLALNIEPLIEALRQDASAAEIPEDEMVA